MDRELDSLIKSTEKVLKDLKTRDTRESSANMLVINSAKIFSLIKEGSKSEFNSLERSYLKWVENLKAEDSLYLYLNFLSVCETMDINIREGGLQSYLKTLEKKRGV